MGTGGDTGSGGHLAGSVGSTCQRPGTVRQRPAGPAGRASSPTRRMRGTDGLAHLRLPGSFDTFCQEHYSGLVQLAFVLSGSRYGAEDIAQDALVAAWKKWGALEQPLAWTRRVVANLAVSAIPADGRGPGHDLTVGCRACRPDRRASGARHRVLGGGSGVADPRQRQMVALYYLGDCSGVRSPDAGVC